MLHSESLDILGYRVRPCLKNKDIAKEQMRNGRRSRDQASPGLRSETQARQVQKNRANHRGELRRGSQALQVGGERSAREDARKRQEANRRRESQKMNTVSIKTMGRAGYGGTHL